MESVRVWPVKPGQVYRPVFDAEEQLVQSFQNVKKKKVPEVFSSPSASGDFHQTAASSQNLYECEAESDYKSSTEVFNLPDKLPPLEHTGTSERLTRIKERRLKRHQQVVKSFNESMLTEMGLFRQKLMELAKRLQQRADNNHTETNDSISGLDDDEVLITKGEDDLNLLWEKCKDRHGDTLDYIEKYKSSFDKLQEAQMITIRGILEKCLKSMLQNAHLPKEDNYKVIETESMVLNQAALSNARASSRLVKNLVERETQRALQMRIDFNERKSNWSQLKISARIDRFTAFLRDPEVVHPGGIETAINELRESQIEIINRRNDLLSDLASIDPDKTDEEYVTQWIENTNKAELAHSKLIQHCVVTCKEVYKNASDLLYQEEFSLEQDLLQLCDQDEVERLLEELRLTVDDYNENYTSNLTEMDVYFEDIALRTGRQMALLGRMVSDLVNIWRDNFNICEKRKGELESEMSDIRHDHDVANQEAEATITLKVNELRQANDNETIEKYERSLERQLKEMLNTYQLFSTQQVNTLSSFGKVMGQQIESYQYLLQQYCDIEEDDLIEMEPWKKPPVESFLTKLSTQAQNAREKWASVLKRRIKKKHLEEEKKAAEQGTVKRIQFSSKSAKSPSKSPSKLKNLIGGKLLPKLAPKSPRQKSQSKKLPAIKKGSGQIKESPDHRTTATRDGGLTQDARRGQNPYSSLALEGDDFIEDDRCIPVFRESILLDRNLADIRNELKLCFARHFDIWKDSTTEKYDLEHVELSKLVETEYEMKEKFNEERFEKITTNISAVRLAELKMHLDRYNNHENQVYQKLKQMMKKITICSEESDKTMLIIENLDEQFIPTFAKAKNEKECAEIAVLIEAEYESVIAQLNENLEKFSNINEETMAEIKDSNDTLLRNILLFKKGGNFSKKEVDFFKNKIRLLENKMIRFYQAQVREMNAKLPEMEAKVNEAKNIVLEQLQTHVVDIKLMSEIVRIQRESAVQIKSEIARIEQMASDLNGASLRIKREFGAFWSPSHDVDQLTASELSHKMDYFKEKLNGAIKEMKFNLSEPCAEKREFYQKWLLNRYRTEEEEADRPASGRSKLKLRRESSVSYGRRTGSRPGIRSGILGSPSKSIATNESTAPSIPNKSSSNMLRGQSSGTDTGTIRRIIRDAKTEVKFQIFQMETKPDPVDSPHRVTGLLFEQTDKILVAYETYYKLKGTRLVTRPDRIPDNFDRAAYKVRIDMMIQMDKSVKRSSNAFSTISTILRRIEDLDGKLPEMVLAEFWDKLNQTVQTKQETIQLKRQKLMDAFDEAKNEHFNSLRITLGHPEFAGQIESLKSRELERKKKHSRAVKNRAEVLRESFEEEVSNGLSEFCQIIQNFIEIFDRRVLLDEIIPPEDDLDPVRSHTWSPLVAGDLPKFESPVFKSKKNTVAHISLFKARDIFFIKMKTMYRSGLLDIKTGESDELEEITRWTTYWKLQLSEVQACFQDI